PAAARGFVDGLRVESDCLIVHGWVLDDKDALPGSLVLRVNGKDYPVDSFDRQARPDVMRHLNLDHALVGYCVRLPLPGLRSVAEIGSDFALFVPDGGRVQLTSRVQQLLTSASR